jgi:hypothetical protein
MSHPALVTLAPVHAASADSHGLLYALGGVVGVVALVALFFDNGILVRVWSVAGRRYKWEVEPVRDPATRLLIARVSHGYSGCRYMSVAVVVVPQSLIRRILWRPFHDEALPRWVIAANLIDGMGTIELKAHEGVGLQGRLKDPVPLPTWRFWAPPVLQDPAMGRLMLVVRFDRRRRTMAKAVAEASGSIAPVGPATP